MKKWFTKDWSKLIDKIDPKINKLKQELEVLMKKRRQYKKNLDAPKYKLTK